MLSCSGYMCLYRGWVILSPVGLTLNTHTHTHSSAVQLQKQVVEDVQNYNGLMAVYFFPNKNSRERQIDRLTVL